MSEADQISVTLQIDNIYEDGNEIQTTIQTHVPPPPESDDDYAYQDWADNYILPHTGTGKSKGDAAYFVKIISSSDPALVGREIEWC